MTTERERGVVKERADRHTEENSCQRRELNKRVPSIKGGVSYLLFTISLKWAGTNAYAWGERITTLVRDSSGKKEKM